MAMAFSSAVLDRLGRVLSWSRTRCRGRFHLTRAQRGVRSGREERGWSGSLRPFIRNVLLPGELAKAAGLPGRPSGGPLARASWLADHRLGAAPAIAGRLWPAAFAA